MAEAQRNPNLETNSDRAPASPTVEVTLSYDMEDNQRLSPPRSYVVTITQDLGRVFARASLINENSPPPLSFSSLLMAMMMEDSGISGWLKGFLELRGVTISRIAAHSSRSFNETDIMSRGQTPGPSPLGMTISARRVIEQARETSEALTRNSPLDVRHLIAAYPVLRQWHEQDFRELGIDRLEWCRAYGSFMANAVVNERRYWREYADRASPVPLTSFSADVYTDKDLLGIDRTIDALALLIASTRTDTPLSVGIFGQWGSGKSFFMQHLRHRIWSLAKRERERVNIWRDKRKARTATANDTPLYFDQIAQVEFNAWHYSDGNIVASLVDHLFRNLQVAPDPSDRELEQRRAAILLKITGAKRDFANAEQIVAETKSRINLAEQDVAHKDKQAKEARKEVDSKARDLDARATEATQAQQDLETEIKQLSQAPVPDAGAVMRVGLQPLLDSPVLRQIRSAAEVFANDVKDWRRFLSQLLTARGLVVILLCVAVPLAAWFTHWLTYLWSAALTVIGTSAATIWHVLGFIRQRRAEFESRMGELEQKETELLGQRRSALQHELNSLQDEWKTLLTQLQGSLEQRRQILAAREDELSRAVRELAERTKELDVHVQERQAAEKRLTDANDELTQLSSTRLLDEFLKNRLATDEYQKQLGFLALVRRDFERLSDLIAKSNAEWCNPSNSTDPPPLNRIVLYIDDLDRCSEEIVLKVLEVVHLLLAFRLFVCVVAVDPRWVEECLRQKHTYLFAGESMNGPIRVTVGDYLEKIFQIPIWTSPIEVDQRAAMVNSLLGKSAAPPAPGRGASQGNAQHLDSPLPPDLEGAAQQRPDAFQALVNKAGEKPDPLRITDDETEFVKRIAGLLSDKPRALKRFVNTYRLLKASLPDVDRESFIGAGPASPYRICLSQLALFTSYPRLAPVLVRHLRKAIPAPTTLDAWFAGLDQKTQDELQPAVNLIPDRFLIPLLDFQNWLPDTSKYLFHRDD
jgi:hypothetical protein